MMKAVKGKQAVIVLAGLAVFLLGTLLLMAGDAKKGYLGVSIEKLDKEGKEEYSAAHGVLVLDVVKGSPAEEAGLEEDDVILFFNSEKIRTADDLVEAVQGTEPGTEVTVKVVRDGKKKDIRVKVGKSKSRQFYSLGIGDKNVFVCRAGGGVYLGVQIQEMNEDLAGYFGVKANEGLLVLEIEEESPAEAAGLKAGDVITEVDSEAVQDSEDIHDIFEGFEEGETVDVTVIRQKRRRTFKVELKENESGNRIDIFGSRPRAILEGHLDHLQMPQFRSRIHIDEGDIKDFYEKKGKHLEDFLEEHDTDLDILLEDLQKHIEEDVKYDLEEKLNKGIKKRWYPIHGSSMI